MGTPGSCPRHTGMPTRALTEHTLCSLAWRGMGVRQVEARSTMAVVMARLSWGRRHTCAYHDPLPRQTWPLPLGQQVAEAVQRLPGAGGSWAGGGLVSLGTRGSQSHSRWGRQLTARPQVLLGMEVAL